MCWSTLRYRRHLSIKHKIIQYRHPTQWPLSLLIELLWDMQWGRHYKMVHKNWGYLVCNPVCRNNVISIKLLTPYYGIECSDVAAPHKIFFKWKPCTTLKKQYSTFLYAQASMVCRKRLVTLTSIAHSQQ